MLTPGADTLFDLACYLLIGHNADFLGIHSAL